MGTSTSRGNFFKSAADGSENVNVVTDLNNNWDRLDAILGWRPVTSGTMPASAFQGAALFQTDTGQAYINQGAGGSAATSYKQVLVEGATFNSGVTIAGSGFYSGELRSTQATGAGRAFVARLTGESWDRWRVDQDGATAWGGGAAETDVYVYRSAAKSLVFGADGGGTFTFDGNMVVGGEVSADTVVVDNSLTVNGGVLRPQPHTTATAANTTSETALQTVTIPANDASIGATYRIRVFGTAAVTGTPTITFRLRLGGTGGTAVVTFLAVTARSGMTDGYWDMDAILTCVTTGVSATWTGMAKYTHNFLTGATTYTAIGPIVTASVTRDSTAAQDYVLTAQWSAASPSNTITARGGESGRVA